MEQKIELNKILIFLKQNLTLLVLGIYSISFINFLIYFKSFNIPIFYYLGLNDLIFYPLEKLCQIFIIIFTYEVIIFITYGVFYVFYEKILILYHKKGLLYFSAEKRNKNRISNVIYKGYDKGLNNLKFILIFILVFVIPIMNFKILMMTSYFVYVIYLTEKNQEKKNYKLVISAVTFIFIVFLFTSTISDCYSKRYEKDDYNISFNCKKEYCTSKSKNEYNYLGETSTHIFLYDLKNKKSLLFQKSSITEMTISNNSEIESLIVKLENSRFLKYVKQVYFPKK